MDNPDDDYLNDDKIIIRSLKASLRAANDNIANLRTLLAAAENAANDGADAIDEVRRNHATIDELRNRLAVAERERDRAVARVDRVCGERDDAQITIGAQSAALAEARKAIQNTRAFLEDERLSKTKYTEGSQFYEDKELFLNELTTALAAIDALGGSPT